MRLYLFILFLCAVIAAFAQDDTSWEVNHYEKTRTFVEDGYTYQCDVRYGSVTLYNKANRWTYADQIDKRTGKIYVANSDASPGIGEENARIMLDIINNAFTKEEAKRITDNGFMFLLFMNPQTGDVEEVCFGFATFNDCAKIPLSYYRDIELKMKAQIHAKLTEEDKYVNFIMAGGVHAPTGRPE